MTPAQSTSSPGRRAWLGLLALTACAAPASEIPTFESPAPPSARAPEPAPKAPQGLPSEASAPSEAIRALPAGGLANDPEFRVARLQISLARAQRERGELRERLESLPPADREGPTGRNLRALLESLEEEIGSMGRELVGLTSQP